MNSRELTVFQDWASNISSATDASIVYLLESFGFKNVFWVMLARGKENYVLQHSDNIEDSFVHAFNESSNYEIVKDWMKETINKQITEYWDTSQVVLYIEKDKYSNFSLITADHLDDNIDLSEIRILIKVAVQLIDKFQKIRTLENALRIGYVSSEDSLQKVSEITSNSLTPSFVHTVVPHIFHSYVHESYGPVVFTSLPADMMEPDYLITAVKLFSGLDAAMVAEVGHVFTTDPINKPTMGEIFSIVFTLPSHDARGKFEVHSLSIVIPQGFSNLSKSLIGEFKTQLFMAIEQLRYHHEEENWAIAVDDFGSSDELRLPINEILDLVRKELALSYALQMDPNDVLNW